MPENFEIIRARVKDDVPVLIDRLMRSKRPEVVFVLPKNSIIAINPNSLKTLKQESESVDKILFINTENQEIKSFAETLGINTRSMIEPKESKKEVQMKQMMDILPPSFKIEPESPLVPEPEKPIIYPVKSQSPEATADAQARRTSNGVYEAESQNSDLEKNLENFYNKSQAQSGGPKKNILRWTVIFLVIAGSVSFLATIYLSLPQANIEVSVKKIPLKINIPVAISKNVNSVNLTSGIIPGQYFLLTKSDSKTIEEKQETLPLKAGGFIDIYNAYSAAPQKLVAQTRFETKDGKIFRIQKSVIIPGAKMSGSNLTPSLIRAEVIADSSGEEYNIGPSYFTIPGFKGTVKYAGFYAKSTEPMIGKTIAAPSLAKENIEKYKKELQNELTEEVKNDTLATLKDSNLKLIDGASIAKIEEFKITNQTITMKITWQAIFFKESDIKALVNYSVSSQNPNLKNFTFESNIEYPKSSQVDFQKGELFFVLEINQDNVMTTDVESLKKELAGLNEDEIRTLISNKNFINSAVISLWPFWVKQVPSNSKKINIKLTQ